MRTTKHKYAKTTGWLRAELKHHGIKVFTVEKLAIGQKRKMKSDTARKKDLEALGYVLGAEDEAFRFTR